MWKKGINNYRTQLLPLVPPLYLSSMYYLRAAAWIRTT